MIKAIKVNWYKIRVVVTNLLVMIIYCLFAIFSNYKKKITCEISEMCNSQYINDVYTDGFITAVVHVPK
jgi:hypothetical protein